MCCQITTVCVYIFPLSYYDNLPPGGAPPFDGDWKRVALALTNKSQISGAIAKPTFRCPEQNHPMFYITCLERYLEAINASP